MNFRRQIRLGSSNQTHDDHDGEDEKAHRIKALEGIAWIVEKPHDDFQKVRGKQVLFFKVGILLIYEKNNMAGDFSDNSSPGIRPVAIPPNV
jgi:hypothetical protein